MEILDFVFRGSTCCCLARAFFISLARRFLSARTSSSFTSSSPPPSPQLVTAEGFFLDPQVTIPQNATNLAISATGNVSWQIDGQTVNGPQLQLARFINPEGLQNLGDNLYAQTAASGQEILSNPGTDGAGRVRQKFLEWSNVEVVSELVSLITAQRAYEINSRAIRAGDEMLSSASDLVR